MNLRNAVSRVAAAAAMTFAAISAFALQTPASAGYAPAGTPLSVQRATDSPIEKYVVPPTLHHLEATVVHTKANRDILAKIGQGFAEGYKVSNARYVYTAPDRVEVHARYGVISGTVVYTNTTQTVEWGFIHKTNNISGDQTKRQTIFVLGVLPQNYLETMRAASLGRETVNGIPCDVFLLRYYKDGPNDARRFKLWVSIDKHYVVKKQVWDGGNNEHETIIYSDPVQPVPGVWVPTQVEAFDPQGELGGVAEQRNISGD